MPCPVARRIPVAACARAVGRYRRGRSPGERVQPEARIPAPEQLPNEGRRLNLGGYGVGPLCDDLALKALAILSLPTIP